MNTRQPQGRITLRLLFFQYNSAKLNGPFRAPFAHADVVLRSCYCCGCRNWGKYTCTVGSVFTT